MKVVKATSYGYRTVVVVCHNPEDPEYLHSDGSVHPVSNIHGCPNDVAGGRLCTYNHRVQDFIWDGEAQFIDGVRRSGESFWEELCQRCASLPTPSEIEGLVGRSS